MSEQEKDGIARVILSVAAMVQSLVACSSSPTMKRLLILLLLFALADTANTQQIADVRAFGTFATFSSTTATTIVGQPTVSLKDAQGFRNGEYVTIFHAGTPCGLPTPAAPTLTPSVNAGGVETISASAGSSGFASKPYKPRRPTDK